ncbi:MAG: DUF4870 domain-containing protein [Pyrinomonadaceae bacterium]|nr:DUF4870 domain-containing protein [Pyrinomonadaceae bacterium]
MAKSKFDTNPLDPEFPEKVREAQTNALPKNDFRTAEFPRESVTEEETRKFNNQDFNSYQSPFNGQNVPVNYQTAPLYDNMNRSSSRKVDKIGLPENVLTALPYIPWFVGLIAGLIILFIVPKSEAKVRFHAAQGLAAHIGILIVGAILSGLGNIVDFASIGSGIFHVVTMVMLIIFAVKAWQGKPVHIESVDDLTEWLEEKIQPKQ